MTLEFISSENVTVIGVLTITLTAFRVGDVETTVGTVVVVGTSVGVGIGVDVDMEGVSFVVGIGEAGVSVAAGNLVGAVDGPAQAPSKTMPITRIVKSVFVFISGPCCPDRGYSLAWTGFLFNVRTSMKPITTARTWGCLLKAYQISRLCHI